MWGISVGGVQVIPRGLLNLAFILALLLFAHGARQASLAQAETQAGPFRASEVIQAVKREIRLAQAQETGSPRLTIDLVELELTTVATKEAGAGLTVTVPTVDVGGEVTAGNSMTQTLSLSLTSLDAPEVSAGESLGLVEVIREVKRALKIALNEPPRFDLGQFQYTVQFALQREANGRLRFVLFELPRAKLSQASSNQITLHISRTR
jgi:hypothetical protein